MTAFEIALRRVVVIGAIRLYRSNDLPRRIDKTLREFRELSACLRAYLLLEGPKFCGSSFELTSVKCIHRAPQCGEQRAFVLAQKL